MHAFGETASIPVQMYRSDASLTIAAPMPGLRPEDIAIRITSQGRLQLRGDMPGLHPSTQSLLRNEWSIGGYYRDLELPVEVNGEQIDVSYANGVLTLVMPIDTTLRPAELTLETLKVKEAAA